MPNVDPRSSLSLSLVTLPPWNSTMLFTMAKPRQSTVDARRTAVGLTEALEYVR